MKTKILIIGGGVSGLRLAQLLHQHNIDHQLVEARARLGGRIEGPAAQGEFDLGPSWFWPGQPRIDRLAQSLKLERVDQHASGLSLYEDAQGTLFKERGLASMGGAYRFAKGMPGLISALAGAGDNKRRMLNTVVTSVKKEGTQLRTLFQDGRSALSEHVVVCLPPRLSEASIALDLSPEQREAMKSIPTWMAGHAKVLALYKTPHWRHAGLSGDAFSRRGPLAEIHDISLPPLSAAQAQEDDRPRFALFGFASQSADARANAAAFSDAAEEQFMRLFGEKPERLIVRDWAKERFTATVEDRAPLRSHPQYGLPETLRSLYDEGEGPRLHLASTESDAAHGGLVEGALAAAERMAQFFGA